MRWKTLMTAALATVIAATPARGQEKPVFDPGKHAVTLATGDHDYYVSLHSVGLQLDDTQVRYLARLEFTDFTADSYMHKHALVAGKSDWKVKPMLAAITDSDGLAYIGAGGVTHLPEVSGVSAVADLSAGPDAIAGKLSWNAPLSETLSVGGQVRALHPYGADVQVASEWEVSYSLGDRLSATTFTAFDGVDVGDAAYGVGIGVRVR